MTTTHAIHDGPTRNRLAYVAVWATATLAYVALLTLGREIAAAGAFVLLAAVAVGYRRFAGVRFDERDTDVLETASGYTIRVLGLTSAVVFPALVLASGLGYFTWTAFAAGVATTVAAVFLLWVAAVAVVRAGR
ncbi:hypothetical protein [Halobaculum magnesiiphilum]|uniref:DUF2178 domain-containing protein n=1 Tax=Halobaculum magnesiiphilum TaxID=1017351 RepID=A0A8T8WG35_9EURY|nr:hypothetical protein [Halobaculum magnesiiphilum]QZP38808.1 hypothetical protein K6T50_06630 [Halobaculum magnesiiphilum]